MYRSSVNETINKMNIFNKPKDIYLSRVTVGNQFFNEKNFINKKKFFSPVEEVPYENLRSLFFC